MRPDARLEAAARSLRSQSQTVALMALAGIRTLRGVHRFYMAERAGARRPAVLRAVEHRIAELGGTELPWSVRIVFGAESVETERVEWEKRQRR